MSKLCNECKLIKEDSEFRLKYDKRRNSSYFCSNCKECENVISKQRYHSDPNYKSNIKLKSNEFRKSNPEYFKEYKKTYSLTPEQISKYKSKAKHYYSSNKEEILQRTKEWKKMRPHYNRGIKLQKFGLTLEDYDNILIDQDNKCPICKNNFTKEFLRRPNIDHCHKTNKFRAILCHKCNTALGLFDDNIESLKEAILYLEKHNL